VPVDPTFLEVMATARHIPRCAHAFVVLLVVLATA
jgi:hypothetical protein